MNTWSNFWCEMTSGRRQHRYGRPAGRSTHIVVHDVTATQMLARMAADSELLTMGKDGTHERWGALLRVLRATVTV